MSLIHHLKECDWRVTTTYAFPQIQFLYKKEAVGAQLIENEFGVSFSIMSTYSQLAAFST